MHATMSIEQIRGEQVTMKGRNFQTGATVRIDGMLFSYIEIISCCVFLCLTEGVEVSGPPTRVVGLYSNMTGYAIEVELTSEAALRWLATVSPQPPSQANHRACMGQNAKQVLCHL
jgi:hypothetical protein